MREIKLRGKSIKSGKWLFGDLIHNRDKVYIAPIGELYFDGATEIDFEVDESTVGQYTGLTDKNGIEIYEGDVLKWMDNRTKVVGWFLDGWTAGNNGSSMSLADLLRKCDCYIVGNIHDNPELSKYVK